MAFGQYNNYGAPQWQNNAGLYSNITVFDKVMPDMQFMVDKHWMQFAPMNPLWHG
jgi:hypothetical protein